MGTYVNPPIDKQTWLDTNGELLVTTSDYSNVVKSTAEKIEGIDKVLVCLVQNFAFSAAAVGTSLREVEEFNNPDGRSKSWYILTKKSIEPYI